MKKLIKHFKHYPQEQEEIRLAPEERRVCCLPPEEERDFRRRAEERNLDSLSSIKELLDVRRAELDARRGEMAAVRERAARIEAHCRAAMGAPTAGEAYEELIKLHEEEAIGDEVDRRYVAGLKEELEKRDAELEGVKEERDLLKEEVEDLKSRNQEMVCMLACDSGDVGELKHRVDKRDAELEKVKLELNCARVENWEKMGELLVRIKDLTGERDGLKDEVGLLKKYEEVERDFRQRAENGRDALMKERDALKKEVERQANLIKALCAENMRLFEQHGT
jgi:hypothetical protein